MAPLGRRSLSNPVDETWQSLREAVLAHPRISGARFDHEIKRVDLVTEKTVVGPRRLSAFVAVDADGTQVVIAGAGKRGLSQQVATELLADVSHRLTTAAPALEDASAAPLPPPAADPIDLSEPRVLRVLRSVPPNKRDDPEKPHSSHTARTPRTPPAPPPPPSPAVAPQPPAAPPRPTAAPPLASPPEEHELAIDDALSELAQLNDWR